MVRKLFEVLAQFAEIKCSKSDASFHFFPQQRSPIIFMGFFCSKGSILLKTPILQSFCQMLGSNSLFTFNISYRLSNFQHPVKTAGGKFHLTGCSSKNFLATSFNLTKLFNLFCVHFRIGDYSSLFESCQLTISGFLYSLPNSN